MYKPIERLIMHTVVIPQGQKEMTRATVTDIPRSVTRKTRMDRIPKQSDAMSQTLGS